MQPSMQQFQYAANGFVLPGAPQGEAPMSAHGGTIGMAQPHGSVPAGSMPMLNGGGSAAAAATPDPYARPQAWAFATPQGMQLVQGGATAQPAIQYQQQYQQAMHVAGAAHGAPTGHAKRRMRWETIIPAAAVACLVAAVALFVSDFDRITGRVGSSSNQSSTQVASTTPADATPAATTPTTPVATPATDAAAIAAARKLFAKGQFDEAANLVHPLVERATPNRVAVALHARIDAAGDRNTALLTRLSKLRRDKQWTGVVSTINALAALRPLSSDLVALRARARQASLQASRHVASPSTSVGSSHTHVAAPPAGGTGNSSTGARPPATVPTSSLPPRPDAPNPISSHGTGAGAVGGGAGGCVEDMPGMDMCPN
jgi:hypothetical protein